MAKKLKYWQLFSLALFVVFFVVLLFLRPDKLFKDPYSAVIKAADGKLLSARIASDGQWRFPATDSIPEKYKLALLAFEDKRFYYHPGFDPVAILRAAVQNIKSNQIISGGSTISMQVIRLSKKAGKRTFSEKVSEIFSAVSLELFKSKEQILLLYATHAPYGGNVVGLEAASWRWFGRPPHDLSWAEAATLAILPNAPSLVTLQRNRNLFEQKRNRLLKRLYESSTIDQLTYELSVQEPLPELPKALPDIAPHFLEFLRLKEGDKLFETAIQSQLQKLTGEVIQTHHNLLKYNQINNLAVIIRQTSTGKIIAYHGNVHCSSEVAFCYNDMVQAHRSSGSILKPFLYASALQDGLIHPNSLLPDIPSWIAGYSPKNFDETYAGAIAADEALRRSLNVPFVHLLRQYGIERFHELLGSMGFTSFKKPATHYGLSLILGGGEVNLWELSEVYSNLARTLLFTENKPVFPIDAGAIWLTTNVLRELNRPETESGWSYSGSDLMLSWKTGTSFGFRDAWAVGYTPEYVIAVWAGNADGAGRPGLTGVSAAAPVLFDLVSVLPTQQNWFSQPEDKIERVTICKHSGMNAGLNCEETVVISGLPSGNNVSLCNYHQLVRTDTSGRFQLPADCFPEEKALLKKWFVLPPLMEYYFRRNNASYKLLPPVKDGCVQQQANMEFIYPPIGAQIYQPVDFSGNLNPLIFEVAHRLNGVTLFWHLDGSFAGTTQGSNHQMVMQIGETGEHLVTVVDEQGNSISRAFKLLRRN
ncbi:MAG: penicillin-binding protein 1C [Bacteroidales bacterium]|nr:penicillin-binding protein 1C [Bacteroidales bacterium]